MTTRGRLLAGIALGVVASTVALSPQSPPAVSPSLQITSPRGRTGLVTTVRIVAQLSVPSNVAMSPLDFYVDGVKVGSVDEGPPYAVEWTDQNPFERREIIVQGALSNGTELRDSVVLPAFEVEERAEVKSVLLETGIYDKLGNPLAEVPASALTIFEDDIPQSIDLVTRETVPTDVVLLVDNSQSMAGRMDLVRGATERIISGLRKSDRVVVAPFNAHIGSITGPTSDAATISEAISAMRAGGGTALLDSVVEGSKLLARSEGRRVLVLITDGFDENSAARPADALRAVKEAQATVYTVGIGGVAGISLRGQTLLREIASAAGGRVYFPLRAPDMLIAAEGVAADAHNRFLVTYTPQNQKRDGRWRSVSVRVAGDYHVRTRSGYFAPAPPPIRPTMEFTVLDDRRRYVDVTADDLEVLENGSSQTIDTFQEAVDPVSLVLAIDQSGSMKKHTELVQDTAREFVLGVRPEDNLALIMFADRATFAHTLSTNRRWSLDAIANYTPLGGTALYDALWSALGTLKGARGRHAVVVITDGRDENNPGTAPGSVRNLGEVLSLGREVGATVFAVGLGEGVDRPVLDRLAEESGGQSYFASDASLLGTQLRRVVADLRRRYVLGYTSTDSTHDGKWRSVEIRSRRVGHNVLGQNGYFSPQE